MLGVTWHANVPSASLDDLRLLQFPFLDFGGNVRDGQLITTQELADSVVQIFSQLLDAAFPIASIRLMHEFSGDDGASMAANNSSCFNSRRILNSSRISLHALGRAIDINPLQNPVVRDGEVRPAAGRPYCDRSLGQPGMISESSEMLKIFKSAGWQWGGNWDNPKDYHHFFLP